MIFGFDEMVIVVSLDGKRLIPGCLIWEIELIPKDFLSKEFDVEFGVFAFVFQPALDFSFDLLSGEIRTD